MKFFIIAVAAALLPAILWAKESASAGVAAIMDERLAPKPVKTEYFEGAFNLSKSSKVSVETPAPLAEVQRQTVIRTFKAYWGFAPSVSFAENPELSKMKPEGYGLEVSVGGMKVEAFQSPHSIPGSFGYKISNPHASVFHSGDVKADPSSFLTPAAAVNGVFSVS